ncbi:Cell wall integrity and stress response component 4 [Cladophialophora chaetospira]|uniref:Cell wall integrity and stress response component 4 n=1 Tax=Cladophialophora chaetospira TaxID=386627 RepID=A0AA39CNG9_9EURO|nr:Cell wall integrity and stress response component 4 [Cladophialophora chaetospira]
MAYTPLVLLLVLIFGHIIHALPIGFCSPDNVASTGPTQSIFMSNGLCEQRCTGEYAYIVIIGQSCYCSDDVPATQVSTDECHDPCPGYPPDFCGNATAGYYAYFNLGRAASATIQLSTAAVSLSSIVAGSTTTVSTYTVPLTTPATSSSTGSSTSTSTGTSTNIVAIQQYIQSALSTQSGPDATDACFLNEGNTLYTSPSWYQHAPTQVQSYFSSTHQDTSATCAALADTLFGSHSHHGLSKGAKAGIIVGAILGALLIAGIVLLAWLCLRRRRRRSPERNSSRDDDEKPKVIAAGTMPTQFDDERSSQHDFDDHSIHGATIDHQQPLYHNEATVTPSTAAPALTYFGSPASRTAMAAAALAWGREHPHDSSAQRVPAAAALAWGREQPNDSSVARVPAHVEPSVTESQASSVYEAAFETPQPQQMSSPTHDGQQGTRPEPPARTNTEQDFYILHQQNPYQFPPDPGSAARAYHEKNIPRKPVGILKNRLNNNRDEEERMTALPRLAGQRDSDQYTFYDENGDDDYPFHAR